MTLNTLAPGEVKRQVHLVLGATDERYWCSLRAHKYPLPGGSKNSEVCFGPGLWVHRPRNYRRARLVEQKSSAAPAAYKTKGIADTAGLAFGCPTSARYIGQYCCFRRKYSRTSIPQRCKGFDGGTEVMAPLLFQSNVPAKPPEPSARTPIRLPNKRNIAIGACQTPKPKCLRERPCCRRLSWVLKNHCSQHRRVAVGGDGI